MTSLFLRCNGRDRRFDVNIYFLSILPAFSCKTPNKTAEKVPNFNQLNFELCSAVFAVNSNVAFQHVPCIPPVSIATDYYIL